MKIVRAQVVDEAPAVDTRPCPRCGAPVEVADRFCQACGDEQRAAAGAAAVVQAAVVAEGGTRVMQCENCGAEVALDVNQRSYTCAFCESNYVADFAPSVSNRQPPEFVIGFAVTRQQAMEKYRQWMAAGGFFRPGDLRQVAVADKLKGIYLPFWAFSMLAESTWSASIGEYWYRTETYTTTENGKTVVRTRTVRETEWWPLDGRHHAYHSGYLVSGSRGLTQQSADTIGPFYLGALRRYEPYYLAGWLAEEYSIEREAALTRCRSEFASRERAAAAAMLPGDTHRNLQVSTEFSKVQSDLILLPVYVMSYRYRGERHHFLVNGQTGKIAGSKPVAWWKVYVIVGVAAALALAVAIVVYATR